MGSAPSVPIDKQKHELHERLDELSERAACAISNADVLLVATGAGWSADSGLAVYRDVANVEEYRKRGLTYHDLCDPHVLANDPELFLGFWGGCFNDYRNTPPHEGYNIIAKWRDEYFARYGPVAEELKKLLKDENDSRPQSFAGPFFSLTSNVDAHWLKAKDPSPSKPGPLFSPVEVYECHGNVERWQCANRMCSASLAGETCCKPPSATLIDSSWPAPPNFMFEIDEETRLAKDDLPGHQALRKVGSGQPYDAQAFMSNHPKCVVCGEQARPAVLMFNDQTWAPNDAAKKRFEEWKWGVLNLCSSKNPALKNQDHPARVVILEIGCGNNVTTIRQKTEGLLADVTKRGGKATLIRINPDFPLADGAAARPNTLPLLSTGLAALQKIDAAMKRGRATPYVDDPMLGLEFEHVSTKEEEETAAPAEAPAPEPQPTGGCSETTPPSALKKAREIFDRHVNKVPAKEEGKEKVKVDTSPEGLQKLLDDIAKVNKQFERFDKLGEQLFKGPPPHILKSMMGGPPSPPKASVPTIVEEEEEEEEKDEEAENTARQKKLLADMQVTLKRAKDVKERASKQVDESVERVRKSLMGKARREPEPLGVISE